MLGKEIAELLLQHHENGDVLVELGHQPLDHFLDLAHQVALGRAFALIALAGLGQRVEQASRRMGLLHEHLAIQQRDLDRRAPPVCRSAPRRHGQVALVQQHVEQHADQVDRVLVHRVEAGLRRIDAERSRR
jgi:hypothetical protein